MTDKELLLIDLSARLPYRVKVLLDFERQFDGGSTCTLTSIKLEETPIFNVDVTLHNCSIEELRPYLRPMSSMTMEEKADFNKLGISSSSIQELSIDEIDWLNAHHFDYRGLILMGLALEAPEGMYDRI